jgi:hypothetical protein
MSVCPIYLAEMLVILSPDLSSPKSVAFKLTFNISIDFAHRTFPFEKLTTGSSDPILTITDPSSKPIPIILLFYFDVSTTQPIPKLYYKTLRTVHELV